MGLKAAVQALGLLHAATLCVIFFGGVRGAVRSIGQPCFSKGFSNPEC